MLEPFGRLLDPAIQHCESIVSDIPSLLQYMEDHGEDNDGLDLSDITTWFPSNDKVAFWTPATATQYDYLTYSQLQHAITRCPPFRSGANEAVRVAIAIPAKEMAHTATALLATIAQPNTTAVPLGPKITWEAIQQMKCHVLVMSQTALEEYGFVLEGKNMVLRQTKEAGQAHSLLEEIRVVEPGLCGRLRWTVFRTKPGAKLTWAQVIDPLSPETTHSIAEPSTPALLLRTSGTTAMPKVVPITRSHLFYAAKTISTTLKLTPEDCCINAMPLFHIGGIACNLLSVLVSGGSVILQGPFSDPMAFLGHITSTSVKSTWYYASPSMHKALALVASTQTQPIPNHLRFCRSASAHLPHELALQLSGLFQCGVIPTYGMSEAMPICSSVPIYHDQENVVGSVGYPTGTSVKIVDPETNKVLPYHQVGEICVKSAGVITRYENLEVGVGFTPNGWLKTGDLGQLDPQGRLYIKGRSKELIKRGGEQIWPNQVDSVIQSVQGVVTAVTFGVPNPLFGEEVATAIVPSTHCDGGEEALRQRILQTCREHLEPSSIPQQIKFLSSTDQLLKGSTGKYLRSKMANHLKLVAVDTGALRLLESMTNSNEFVGRDDGDKDVGLIAQDRCVIPHESLNGLRFLVSCYVVHTHVGLFPNLTWIKLQSYTPNMMIFFALGAFQTTCSVARPVRGQWAAWVGSKIGALHALFLISQLFTLPSYLLWTCLDEQGDFVCEAFDYVSIFGRFIVGTATGLIHGLDVNYFAWFQSTFYLFLIFFPLVDYFLRRRSLVPTVALVMVATLITAVIAYVAAGTVLPSEFFDDWMWLAQFSMVTWVWYLIASMCAAYFFKSNVWKYAREARASGGKPIDSTETTEGSDGQMGMERGDSIDVETIKHSAKRWGVVCDICSMLLLGIYIAVATYTDDLCVKPETMEIMRGLEELDSARECLRPGITGFVVAKNVTYDEFVTYIHPDISYLGRYDTLLSQTMGYWKMSCPLFLLWIFAMAFGNSITSSIFVRPIMVSLAPLGYPIYLLHNAVARYYWMATRGLELQYWWIEAGVHPFPVEWYEYFTILGITIMLGAVVNRWLVPIVMPHTIKWGVSVCSWISACVGSYYTMCFDERSDGDGTDEDSNGPSLSKSTLDQIKFMVLGMTGVQVTRSMELRTLGLDSLGSTALLGMLRASVPAAKNLTLRQLQSCETVGDLADVLSSDEIAVRSSLLTLHESTLVSTPPAQMCASLGLE